MKKSSKPQVRIEAVGPPIHLDLPDGPGLISLPPDVSVEQAISLNEQAKEWFPHSSPTPEERWSRKTDVEFVL